MRQRSAPTAKARRRRALLRRPYHPQQGVRAIVRKRGRSVERNGWGKEHCETHHVLHVVRRPDEVGIPG
eukprot:scaffold166852_cov32-Tisochrysis_lutea.AAC.3